MKKLITLSVFSLLLAMASGCAENNKSVPVTDPGQTIKDTGEAKDDGIVINDTVVKTEDVTENDTSDTCDSEDISQPPTIEIAGRVWGYSTVLGNDYTYNPVAGVKVLTHGLTNDVSVVTADKDCGGWWNQKVFECGAFVFKDVPKDDEKFYLEVPGTDSYPACLSQNFDTSKDLYTFMVMVGNDMVKAASALWNIPWNDKRGLVIGLVADGIEPQKSPPITGFIGDAKIEISPLPNNKDFQMVYLDSANLPNKGRKMTDPAQSMFFLLNMDPSQSKNYTLTINHKTYTFPKTTFHVESDKITYLLIRRNK